MKKLIWFSLLAVLTLLLSACAQQTPTEVASTEAPAATEAEVEVQEETATEPVQESGETSGAAECRPYNLLDEILAAPDPNLAPVTEDDNVLGPDDAELTILEFSDFQ